MKQGSGISGEILSIALRGLEAWENAGISIDDYLDSPEVTDSGLRRAVSSILFGYFRNKPMVDVLVRKFASDPRPRYRRIIVIATVQALLQDGIASESAVNIAVGFTRERFGARPAGFVNAVMRRIIRENISDLTAGLPEWAKAGIPETVYRRWLKEFGEAQYLELAEQFKRRPGFTFRLCGDIGPEELAAVAAEPLPEFSWAPGFRFCACTEPGLLLERDWTGRGMIYIQDPSTALSVSMIDFSRKIERVVDLCAAPGGKSLMIAERLPETAEFIASDRSERRQRLTRKNLDDHGFGRHEVMTASALEPPFPEDSFDLVFLDVPCSNSGVFRRRPDALWRFSSEKLAELVMLQRDILRAGSRLVCRGGQLVYSTCSIDPDEDQRLVAAFLAEYPRFKLSRELLLLPGAEHDGAYAALLIAG